MKASSFGIILAILVLTFSGFTAVYAASGNSSEKTQMLAAQALLKKIQADLSNTDVRVKIDEANQYQVSDSQIGIKGNGVCLLESDAEQLPINFDVKIDAKNLSVADVEYSFANLAAETTATAAMEEAVTLKLLKQVAAEHKTSNVVIALDSLNVEKNPIGENRLTGTGEARIGDFEWRKIQVEVQLDGKGLIKTVGYKVQE